MPGIIEEWSALDYALRTVRLINADQFWTESLSREDLTGEETGELAQFASGEILAPWLHLSDSEVSKPLLDFVVERSTVALASLQSIVRDQGRQHVRWLPQDREALVEDVWRAIGGLNTDRHLQAETLTDKIKNLQAGNWRPGDLNPPNVCNLLVVASASTAALGRYDLAAYLLALHAALGCLPEAPTSP
ncbi:hypothetical protein ACFWV1_08120 [Streptomyces sp. NPDC058700]|uniref:hypothetical protein n=1 Tax=Streptomyces sp. NPDC058700 TaxID=3346607 RepID=UPI00365FA5AC